VEGKAVLEQIEILDLVQLIEMRYFGGMTTEETA